jgi:sulfate transport system ATP-binding protein
MALGPGKGIQVRSVARRFGSFVALDDVSIDVPGGSLTALLGPSGSGKSTLLRVIAGLETPDCGAVLLDGTDVTRTPPQARGVGFVFQHYAAFRHMTVWNNVAFGLQVRKRPAAEIRARVAELLQLVQLDGLSGRYPAQLSGGQRQRMALARALAVRPEVLLLDEPFGALDARVRQELRDWLRRLHDEVRVTTLLVTHDQEEAMEVADRVVVMDHGRVQQAGSPRELYEQPANAFVMSFVGPVNHVDGTFVRPHDVVIHPVSAARAPAGREAVVERLTHLGFEVRVDLALTESGTRLWSQITRADVERLGLARHQRVYVESLRARTFDEEVRVAL